MSFFDVFGFFSQTELTDELRKYELICVSAVSVLSLAVTVALIIKNNHPKNGDKNDDVK